MILFPQTTLEKLEFRLSSQENGAESWQPLKVQSKQPSICCIRPSAAAAGTPGIEASAGAPGAPEEDGEPPHGAGAGEAAEGAETPTAQEQGERTRE